MNIPEIFKEDIFIQALEKSEIANLSKEDRMAYEQNLKIYRDYKNTIDTAYDEGKLEGKIEGKIEGKLEGKIETAKNLKALGISTEIISQSTGLTQEVIKNL